MPRKSAAHLALVPPGTAPKPLAIAKYPQPPKNLPAAQAALWRQIVRTKPADWFTEDSLPMLAQLCRHIATSNVVEAQIEHVQDEITSLAPLQTPVQLGVLADLLKMRDRESRSIVMLSRTMRLTQQSRLKAETAHNQHGKTTQAAPRPWETTRGA